MPQTVALLLLLAVISLAACERQPPPDPEVPAAPASSTPVLDEYRGLFAQLDREQLFPVAFVAPVRPGLVLEGGGAADAERLTAYLRQCGGVLDQVAALSRQAPETFPPHPEAGTGQHMEHPMAWFQNFARLLNADAGRLWDAGDAEGAAQRITAAIRLGSALCDQRDRLDRLTGVGIVSVNARKAENLFDAGLKARISSGTLDDLRMAVEESNAIGVGAPLGENAITGIRELRSRLGI